MQQFTVSGLALDTTNNAPVVLLRELDGERVLPIWIGPAEANAIALCLAGPFIPCECRASLLG